MNKNQKNFVCKILLDHPQTFELTYFNHYLELPWDEPTKTNKEYLDWLNNKVNRTPWIKMDSQSLGMCGSVVFLPRKYHNIIGYQVLSLSSVIIYHASEQYFWRMLIGQLEQPKKHKIAFVGILSQIKLLFGPLVTSLSVKVVDIYFAAR